MAETVLVVDDDPVQRRLLEGMATRFGYEVVTVEGGDAAVAALTAPDARIDCMVLDLVMPDLDGYGVLARMREAGVNVPVIVQTAHGGIDKVVSAMRAGASLVTSVNTAAAMGAVGRYACKGRLSARDRPGVNQSSLAWRGRVLARRASMRTRQSCGLINLRPSLPCAGSSCMEWDQPPPLLLPLRPPRTSSAGSNSRASSSRGRSVICSATSRIGLPCAYAFLAIAAPFS